MVWRISQNVSCTEFSFWKNFLNWSSLLNSTAVEIIKYITSLLSHSRGEFDLQKSENDLQKG